MIANLDMPLVRVLNSCNAFQSQTLSASGSTEDSDSFLRGFPVYIQLVLSKFFMYLYFHRHLSFLLPSPDILRILTGHQIHKGRSARMQPA